jgi:hypothetical protein
MKKSTNESDAALSTPEKSENLYKPPLLWEMFIMEGGISLLIIFPLVVLFFLKKAYESV